MSEEAKVSLADEALAILSADKLPVTFLRLQYILREASRPGDVARLV